MNSIIIKMISFTLKILFSTLIVFVVSSCASKINLDKQVLRISNPLPCKAAIYIEEFKADHSTYSSILKKTPRNYYRDFIKEIFGITFSEVVIVDNLSDVESTESIVVINIRTLEIMDMETLRLVHNVIVDVHDINGKIIFSSTNTARKMVMNGGVNDHRNITILSLTPIVSELSKDKKVLSYITSNSEMKYASQYARQTVPVAQEPKLQHKVPTQSDSSNNRNYTLEKSKLQKYKKLYDDGLITKEEYDLKREEVLDSM